MGGEEQQKGFRGMKDDNPKAAVDDWRQPPDSYQKWVDSQKLDPLREIAEKEWETNHAAYASNSKVLFVEALTRAIQEATEWAGDHLAEQAKIIAEKTLEISQL